MATTSSDQRPAVRDFVAESRPYDDQVQQLKFTCGGVRFTLTQDDDGRWDHNKHAEKVLNSFGGGGPKEQIEIVEALCELMSDGLIPPRRGAEAAQGCYKLTRRESCRTVHRRDKDLMFLVLSTKQRPAESKSPGFRKPSLSFNWGYSTKGQSEGLTESANKQYRNYIPPYSFDADVKWLRKAMALCDSMDEDHAGFSAVNERLVSRFAAETENAWQRDPTLWSDYLDWALPREATRLDAVRTLSSAISGSEPLSEGAILCGVLAKDDIPSDPHHPATVLFRKLSGSQDSRAVISNSHTWLQDGAVRHSNNIGLLVAAAVRQELVLAAAFGQIDKGLLNGLEPATDDFDRCRAEVTEICGEDSMDIPFAYEAPTILWKTAFRQIVKASLAVDSLILAPGVVAGTLDEFLLESFRSGPREWSPLHSGLAVLMADAAHQKMTGKIYLKGHIAPIAARDLDRLSKYLLERRAAARGTKPEPTS